MKKTIVLGALLASFIPSLSLAATYQYIDLTGKVVPVEAASTLEALTVSSTNTVHSGVQIAPGKLQSGESFGFTFAYVDAMGNLKTITASGPDAAFILVSGVIAANSGVMMAATK